MKVYLGIDLGSTTSKAVILNSEEKIIGRGITNTRANYEVAAEIARMEAEFNSRFSLLKSRVMAQQNSSVNWPEIFEALERCFHFLQFKTRFGELLSTMKTNAGQLPASANPSSIQALLQTIKPEILNSVRARFLKGEVAVSSEFFRDLFSSIYLHIIQDEERSRFDQLLALYDRSITPVENQVIKFDFEDLTCEAVKMLSGQMSFPESSIHDQLEEVANLSLEPEDYIGTGYGRQLLPFEKEHIKSEILCHAMGAHSCFPQTRTVLDIGGQDTKAIQVDSRGFVTSFQMNDRCAAGCGRYLGYIADEMNISVGELGPLAMKAEYEANICSTCTVFAGAELREYLNLGEKKENILAGLHKAIVERAFALLARSGGVRNQFTFTGGVARNSAVVKYVGQLVTKNYGEVQINTHTDSIFMGAMGAALFSARRN